MSTGKKRRITIEVIILLILLAGILLWRQGKNKITVISAVLPKEYQTTEKEWIAGMKECSKTQEFQLHFFFEKEEDLDERIAQEKEVVSAVITKEDRNPKEKDAFLDGYEKASKLAKNSSKVKKMDADAQMKVGISLYDLDDQFVQSLAGNIEKQLKKMEQKEDIRIVTAVEDAEMDEQKQENQIQYLMEQDCDIIVVNLVDTWSASKIIHRAKEKNIPLIFFNREPSDEDFGIWNQIAYVGGTDGKKLGEMQADLLIEEFQNDPDVDKNKDETLQYILVEGEEGHRDTIRRTDSMYKKLKKAVSIEQIASIAAGWDRKIAKENFLSLPEETVENCEAVICNNDEMALGIMDAYQEKQIEKNPVIVGIDGITEMKEAIESGQIYGTISQNPEEQSKKVVEMIGKLWKKQAEEEPSRIYIEGTEIKKP